MIKVTLVPVLKDNYSYILEGNGQCAVLDPGEADPVIRILDEHGLKPDYILNTHHHADHVAGNQKVKDKYKSKIVGPAAEEERIVGIDIPLDESSSFTFAGETAQIIETPGHTSGHICFYFADSGLLFAGDTLFSMGCGRLFDGTAEDMFGSLQKLKVLPAETKLYCGHEYTLANAEFCYHAAPDNEDIKTKLEHLRKLRANGKPSIPSTLAEELKTNLFLTAKSAQDFATLRAQKDNF
ncbi:MAG: hydroxyacylglutathione hydrolase [Pseudomonadota bacterium]